MSTDPHKWFRKRPAEDDLEVLSDHDGDHEQEDEIESIWKVKTLDEILQEKRKRLEEEGGDKVEEPAIEREQSEPASRSSSVAASPGPVKRGRLSSSPAEVIYQLSPGQQSYSSLSSGGATPSGSKPLAPQDVSKVKSREGKRRRPTEEEEGEIVSEGSEHEDEAKSRGSRHASVGDVEMKIQGSIEEGNKDGSEKTESDEESNDDVSSESESEIEEVVQMGEKPNLKVSQEKEKEEQDTESDASEESDSESEDESEDKSSEEEETQIGSENNETSKVKNKKGDDNEAGKDDDDDDNDDDNDNDDDDDDDDDEESESEDESSEDSESENEQPGKEPVVEESPKVVEHIDEEETEDIHKELLQVTESQKQKDRAKKQRKFDNDKTRRDRSYGYDDRSQKSKEYTRASNSRKYQERDKRQVEDQRGRKEHPSREQSYEKKDTRHREKNIERSSNSRRLMEKSRSKESIGPRDQPKEKYSTTTRDMPPKSSKLDLGTWKSPRESDSFRKDTKSSENPKKESKESRDYRRGPREDKKRKQVEKSRDTEKPVKTERAVGRKDVGSSVLTEQERKQFSREVVDLESDGGSSTDENVPSPNSGEEHKSDTAMHSDKEQEKEPERPKLPLYLPAIRGCRNVEEFQWLNRIEEGTYGVVYRAKDKRTSEIVALKRLKMEKEKEGFPITSLREINTLLKSQHPNIVTVREIVVGSNMDKIYIVMDYVEHDLKALMEHMPNPFLAGEVKTLMIQLLRAVAHLHDNWILHRDLKTSNLLLSNKGILKVGDFGLAREYGSPLRHYTPIVVTLWYRAPELLLGVKEYSTPIDLWSVGCIFAELLTMKPLFPGRSEIDQINKIFKELGTPSDKIWPGPPSYSELPAVKKMTFTEYPYNNLRNKFGAYLTDKGFDLLNRFLTYDPQKRITAEQALKHGFFTESPMPVDPSMFPSWPAKSELTKRPKRKDYEHSPQAPEGGASFAKLGNDDSGGFHIATLKKGSSHVPGFSLKF